MVWYYALAGDIVITLCLCLREEVHGDSVRESLATLDRHQKWVGAGGAARAQVGERVEVVTSVAFSAHVVQPRPRQSLLRCSLQPAMAHSYVYVIFGDLTGNRRSMITGNSKTKISHDGPRSQFQR